MKKIFNLIFSLIVITTSLSAIREDSPASAVLSPVKFATDIYGGKTQLHWAAKTDFIEKASALIDQGANVNAQAPDGKTPLHEAACWGKVTAVARLLLERGANMYIRDCTGRTAFDYAFLRENYPLMQLLSEHNNPRSIFYPCPFDIMTEGQEVTQQEPFALTANALIDGYLKSNGDETALVCLPSPRKAKHLILDSETETTQKKTCF